MSVDVKGRETRETSKLTKEMAAVVVPELAKIIAVSVSAVVTSAFKEVTSELTKMLDISQKQALLNRYVTDKLEQYQRKDSLCIYGLRRRVTRLRRWWKPRSLSCSRYGVNAGA